MKNIIYLILGISLLTSCEFTEKVYVQEDGTIKYSMRVDMSQINALEKNKPMDNGLEFPIDTILSVDEMQNIDVMPAREVGYALKDERVKEIFDDFKFRVQMDESYNIISLFTQMEDVHHFNQFFAELDAKKNALLHDSVDTENREFNYSGTRIPIQSKIKLYYSGNEFKREGTYENMLPSDDDFKELNETDAILQSLTTYAIEYHFPKPITSISDPEAMMSFDRKTVYIRKSMRELVENPKAYNFSVTFD